MNILLLGQGAREHAIAESITKSKLCSKLFIAPGNDLTNKLYNKLDDLNTLDSFDRIKQAIINNNIELIISGPEGPLVKGIYDYLNSDPKLTNLKIIGPCQKGAMLEGSKVFSKNFMKNNNIPTAKYTTFTKSDLNRAIGYLSTINFPIVIKADGLAAGKGVIICQSSIEAETTINKIFKHNLFGNSGDKIVVEEFLNGIEASIFVALDGKDFILLPSAKDYKKIGLNDTGPNTGGMGAISPVPFLNDTLLQKIKSKIIIPTIEGLNKEHITYKGFLFIGIMIVNNEPYVLEYNVRLGDPETECILPKIESDFVELLVKINDVDLKSYDIKISDLCSSTIVLASDGYPNKYETGKKISNTDKIQDSIINYAGIKAVDSDIYTNGGRVLTITSLATTLKSALDISLKNAELIQFENKYYRSDIGYDML